MTGDRPVGIYEAVKTFSDQSANRPRVVFLLCIFFAFAVVSLGLVYLVGDLAKYQEAISVKESQSALRGVNDSEQLDEALRQFPANGILKLVALARREAIELDAAAQQRLAEAEPRALSTSIESRASSRGDLDALRRDLQLAKSNTAAFETGYIAFIKAERGKIEGEARSFKVGSDTIAKFMAMLDEQDRDIMALTSKVVAARLEYYSAYEKCAELLTREFGSFKLENGQFVFPFQHSADSYNRGVAAMTAAAKRMTELEGARTSMRPSQFKRWKAFAEQ